MASIFFGISNRSFLYDRTIGRHEFAGSGLRQPMDLALGPGGLIYLVNRAWEQLPIGVRVTMLTIDEEYIGQFSKYGSGDGELIWPTSIALDSEQNVYVADEWLNRISIFDKDGKFLHKWGVAGSGAGELNKPSGIRFDKEDNLFVVDSANNRVQVFTKDGSFRSGWGEQGSSEGHFKLPWGLTLDDMGNIYVADWGNDRVQKFNRSGSYLAEFGVSGGEVSPYRDNQYTTLTGVGQFCRPTGVAVDKDGDIYIADWGNNRVQVLTADGRHVTTFTGEAGLSKWAHEKLLSSPDLMRQRNLLRDFEPERRLWRPTAVAVDEQGRVIIVDGNRGRLQVYQKENYAHGPDS